MAGVIAACALTLRAAPGATACYVVVVLGSGLLPVAIAWLTALVLDAVVSGAPLTAPTLLLGLAGVLAASAPHATQYLRGELDRRVKLLAQDRLFGSVERFTGLARFEDPAFLDRLRLGQQAGTAAPAQVVDGLLGTGKAVVTVGGFLASLLVLNPVMAGLTVAAGVPALFAQLALSRRRARMLWRIGPVERREFFYSHLLSSVQAATEVRLHGSGRFLRGRMMSERRSANAEQRAVGLREASTQTALAVLASAIATGGLLWAVGAARAGVLTVGGITLFATAVAGVSQTLAGAVGELAKIHQALLMFGHYRAVTTAPPDLPIAAEPRELPSLREGIELRDVWFRYADDHPWILRGVDLHIPSGKAVALVGLNGAGKSTLVKLLCRLYDPTRGVIRWDGVDLRDVDPASLRRRLGTVFQDYVQYDLSAAENIALGDPAGLDDRPRIHAAARVAGIHETLDALPRGYDTVLSRMFFDNTEDAGVVLSGGQWQRLALARAFFRRGTELMILDEPSAKLDPTAEHEIHAALQRHREGVTSLLVSHRLGVLRDADLIVVLRDGRIAERGGHTELMCAGGDYARLFTMQAAGYARPA